MKRLVSALALALGLSGPALAVKPNDPVYVRVPSTKLLKDPKASSVTIGNALPSGTKVTWEGADPKNKEFHKVKSADKEGYLHISAITPKEPFGEYPASAGGKAIDPKAFASSGAATKALSEAGLKYASKKGSKELAAQIITAEGTAKVTLDRFACDFAKSQGLSQAKDCGCSELDRKTANTPELAKAEKSVEVCK